MTDPAASRIALRVARAEDLGAVRDLHIASWRDTYAAFVSDRALASLDFEMTSRWSELPSGVTCAWTDDRLVGFVRVRRRDGWPYIDNLHTEPELRSGGIGARLLRAAAQDLVAGGEGRMWLTVIAGNRRARAFYRRQGGVEAGTMVERVLGESLATRAIVWNRLAPLVGEKGDGGRVDA